MLRGIVRGSSIGLIIVALVGGHIAYLHWTLHRIHAALLAKDVDALEPLVDWPRVRDDLKSELRALFLAHQPAGAAGLGGMLGGALGSMMVDQMIESMVSPAGIR